MENFLLGIVAGLLIAKVIIDVRRLHIQKEFESKFTKENIDKIIHADDDEKTVYVIVKEPNPHVIDQINY